MDLELDSNFKEFLSLLERHDANLRQNKLASGRLKDLADLEGLPET
jgi:hypothetical protein